MRKSIPRNISRLILANKKIFWKNRTLPSLSLTEQFIMTISKISGWDLSIFCAPTSIFLAQRPNFVVKAGWIALISLPKFIRALILLWLSLLFFLVNCIRYQMHGPCSRVAFHQISIIRAEVVKIDTSSLRFPDSFKVLNSFLQNTLSFYSCKRWLQRHFFNLRHYVPHRGI